MSAVFETGVVEVDEVEGATSFCLQLNKAIQNAINAPMVSFAMLLIVLF
jgi:hypothetical protein